MRSSPSQRFAYDLMAPLTGEERNELARNYTTDPEAYRLYMEGRYQWGKRAGAGMRKVVESFQQAIGIDSNYALDMLDQSYAERSDHLPVICIAPDVESLRSEPRFVELLRRVGLTQ